MLKFGVELVHYPGQGGQDRFVAVELDFAALGELAGC